MNVEGKLDYNCAKLCIKTPDMRTKRDGICFLLKLLIFGSFIDCHDF